MTTGASSIEWIELGMGLFGGMALFLLGLDLMTKGLRAVAGEGLKTILAKLTRNRGLEAAIRGIRDDDPGAAREVLALRPEIAIGDGLKRIYTLSKRIAKMSLPADAP